MAQLTYLQAITNGARRRDGARSQDLSARRGRGAQRLRQHPRTPREVWFRARARYANFRGRLRRRRGGRRDGGVAADLRNRNRALHLLRLRSDRQSGRQAALHVGRPGPSADHLPHFVWRGGRRRCATFRNRVPASAAGAGAQDRGALGSRRHEGPAQERDPRRQPRDRVRACGVGPQPRRSARRRLPGPDRQGQPSSAKAPMLPWWQSARWCRG